MTPAARRATRALLAALLALAFAAPALAQSRVGDLTRRVGDVPRRLAGYGLVTGLDGTGDRSFGGSTATTPTVRSVINLLRRFGIEVPAAQLRLRDVAAVMVTAEVSPWLRAGGRFEVQVSALGDATSLRGGVLWITPLVTDPNQPAVATAQGPLYVSSPDPARAFGRQSNAGRIPSGGVLEADPPALALSPRLLLRDPDLATASRIAQVITAAYGDDAATVEDPGAVALAVPKDRFKGKDNEALGAFLTAVDTLSVTAHDQARIVIDAREGTVVAGGDLRIGPAVVSHHGITLEVVPVTPTRAPDGLVRAVPGAQVQDVAAGLHAGGARPDEIAAIFQALESAGALRAEVLVR